VALACLGLAVRNLVLSGVLLSVDLGVYLRI
jgi:hypothetical protein